MIRRPSLLTAALSEKERLQPTAGSVTLKMVGASEATLTLDESAPAVKVHDWISIYTQRGFTGIFRVSNIAQTYKKQIDLTLLHGIDILSDSVWAAQTDFSGTKAQFITALLNQQTQLINGQKPWVLGTCADTATYEKTINYDRLSSLLDALVEEGDDYYFTYDQSSFPWVLNYVAKNQTPTSEFRLTRNVRSAAVTYNDADLCTRLILSVNVKVQDEDTEVTSTDSTIRTYNNTTAQAEWGIVVKTADIDTKDDLEAHHYESADAWAAAFMSHRAAPSVQIQIDGDELKALTGDTWDECAIGRVCQVALPAYGHTFLERVVTVTYPDFLKHPEHVTVSLANTLPKFSENIASAQTAAAAAAASARGAARGGASAKEMAHWSQIVKYYGEALDGTGVLTLYESGIDMDATSGVKIYSLVEGVQALYADITVNANAITSVVQKTGVNSLGQNETLFSKVTQTASDITSVVQKTGVNSLGQNETLYSKITQEAGRIDLVVSGSGNQASIRIDSIVSGINNSGSAVTIDAGKIYLNGQVIANSISAVNTEVANLKTGVTKATLINADSVVADNLAGGTVSGSSVSIGSGSSGGSGTLYYRGSQYVRQGIVLGGAGGSIAEGHFLGDSSTTLNLDHYHTISASEGTGADAGKIIITLGAPSSTEGSTNFNIAATTAYQNGVLAARNAVKVNPFTANAVSGSTPDHRTFTYATDAPTPAAGTSQEDTWYLAGGTSWSNNKTSVGLHYGSASGTTYALLEVDASSLVTDATNAGKAAVGLADPTWNAITGSTPDHRTATVTTTGRTNASGVTDNLSKSLALYLTQGSWSSNKLTVAMRYGGTSGTVYAQTQVDAGTLVSDATYAGKASVTLNDPTWNAISGAVGTSRTLSVTTSGRTDSSGTTANLTKSAALYLTASGLTVSLRHGSTSGAVVASQSCSDSNLTAGNIKSGVTIFGVTGTHAGEAHTVQANRTVTYSSNGEKTLNPSSGYNVMSKATITVSVPDPDITLPSSATTSSSSGTNDKNYSVSAAYKYIRIKVTAGSKSKTIQITRLDT